MWPCSTSGFSRWPTPAGRHAGSKVTGRNCDARLDAGSMTVAGTSFLADELLRAATVLAPEGDEVGAAVPSLDAGDDHCLPAVEADRVFSSVQRVEEEF